MPGSDRTIICACEDITLSDVKTAIENELLIIPGNVFSERDTHFRIAYTIPDDRLAEGRKVHFELALALSFALALALLAFLDAGDLLLDAGLVDHHRRRGVFLSQQLVLGPKLANSLRPGFAGGIRDGRPVYVIGELGNGLSL